MRFIEACLKGDVIEEEIDQFVEAWHEGREGKDLELHEFLGMEWREYQLWSTSPSVLPFILTAHKYGTSLDAELNRNRAAMAARAPSVAEAEKVEAWLRSMSKI
jgi:hypothetical protein